MKNEKNKVTEEKKKLILVTFYAACVNLLHIFPTAGRVGCGKISESILNSVQRSTFHPHIEAFYTINKRKIRGKEEENNRKIRKPER